MRNYTIYALAGSCLLLTTLVGCGSGQIEQADAKLPANESSAGYLDRISTEPAVTENDALRGVALLLDGQDEAETFGQRVESLRQRKLVAASWDANASQAITKGKLAYMVYQACKMKGGLTLMLTGPSQRYCLRELQYAGVMDDGSWFTPVTGMEMVAIMNRADSIIQTGSAPHVLNLKGE